MSKKSKKAEDLPAPAVSPEAELAALRLRLATYERVLGQYQGPALVALVGDRLKGNVSIALSNVSKREALQLVESALPALREEAVQEEVQERLAKQAPAPASEEPPAE